MDVGCVSTAWEWMLSKFCLMGDLWKNPRCGLNKLFEWFK